MDQDKIKAFAGKVFEDMAGGMAAGLAYVGTRTGLFRAMSGNGPMSMDTIVLASGLKQRYVQEWLNGMVCSKYLEYDPDEKTFELPDEYSYLLASEGSDHFVGGLFYALPMMLGVAPRVAAAFETGGGVPFEDYGEDGILAIDLMTRGLYEQRFSDYWLKSIPEVHATLEKDGRVLDFGCGAGRAVLAMAKAFPRSVFTGLDLDKSSIEQAEDSNRQSGPLDNLRFVSGSVSDLDPQDQFDLITVCDCIHDLTDPIGVLKDLYSRLKSDGTLFAIEPKVADHLEDNINAVGSIFYGMSVFHCMTQSLAAGGPGLGTCLGPAGVENLVRQAGFSRFEVLDIKSQMNLFYAVRH